MNKDLLIFCLTFTVKSVYLPSPSPERRRFLKRCLAVLDTLGQADDTQGEGVGPDGSASAKLVARIEAGRVRTAREAVRAAVLFTLWRTEEVIGWPQQMRELHGACAALLDRLDRQAEPTEPAGLSI